jgi:4-hydroxybenzoate polyprenyltransferase
VIVIQATTGRDRHKAAAYIALARPKHWLKNILVFIPFIYAQQINDFDSFWSVLRCFAAFCLLSSSIYAINDLADAASDRAHPTKCKRPIACGQIGAGAAIVYAALLFAAGMSAIVFWYGNWNVVIFAAVYYALNLAYSFFLKHYAIIDCFCLAAGFVLRIYAGGAAIGVGITEWLFLTMTTVSLFMAFGKRRGEMLRVSDTDATRRVLASYDLQFLDGMVFACAGLSVVFYALWAMASVGAMIYTVPVVVFIVCKYLLIVHGRVSDGDPTTVILGDKGLMAAIAVFGLLSVYLLYF